MAELKFKITADLNELKKDLQNLFKQTFKVGGKGGGGAAGKIGSDKKRDNLLGGIFARLAPVVAILSLKPILDIISLFFNFVLFFSLKQFKMIKEGLVIIWNASKILWGILKTWFPIVVDTLKTWFGIIRSKIVEWWMKAIDWLKSLPSRIWTFLKMLPSKIWEFLKVGFTFIRDKLALVGDFLKEKLTLIKDTLIAKFIELREKLIEKLAVLREKIVSKFLELKDKIVEKFKDLKDAFINWLKNVRDFLGDKLKSLIDKIKELPGKIWDFLKSIPGMIADSLRGILSNLNPFRRSTDVGDAIIRPNGDVIKTDPNDVLIASKTGESGGGTTIINNFFGLTMDDAIDKLQRQLAINQIISSRF